MKKHTAHCILNHTITTRSRWRLGLWWTEHAHADVKDVYYDNEGGVSRVVYR